MTNILLINGSPSAPSRSQGILEYAIALLTEQGVKTDLISVRDLPAEDLVFGKYNSPNLEPIKALLAEADAVIISTPIYKASYTGLLKTFLDLLPQKALSNKVILPIATGGIGLWTNLKQKMDERAITGEKIWDMRNRSTDDLGVLK